MQQFYTWGVRSRLRWSFAKVALAALASCNALTGASDLGEAPPTPVHVSLNPADSGSAASPGDGGSGGAPDSAAPSSDRCAVANGGCNVNATCTAAGGGRT